MVKQQEAQGNDNAAHIKKLKKDVMNRLLRLSQPMMASCLQKLVNHSKMNYQSDKRKGHIISRMKDFYRVNLLHCLNKLKEACTESRGSEHRKIEYVVNWMIDKESSSILRSYFQMKENRAVSNKLIKSKISSLLKRLTKSGEDLLHSAYDTLLQFNNQQKLQSGELGERLKNRISNLLLGTVKGQLLTA